VGNIKIADCKLNLLPNLFFAGEARAVFGGKKLLNAINRKLDKISLDMEKSKLNDYVYYLENPRKILFSNFIGGLARGFGMAVGFTLLGALIIYVLRWLVKWNLPVIGKFISEIINIVQDNMYRK